MNMSCDYDFEYGIEHSDHIYNYSNDQFDYNKDILHWSKWYYRTNLQNIITIQKWYRKYYNKKIKQQDLNKYKCYLQNSPINENNSIDI